MHLQCFMFFRNRNSLEFLQGILLEISSNFSRVSSMEHFRDSSKNSSLDSFSNCLLLYILEFLQRYLSEFCLILPGSIQDLYKASTRIPLGFLQRFFVVFFTKFIHEFISFFVDFFRNFFRSPSDVPLRILQGFFPAFLSRILPKINPEIPARISSGMPSRVCFFFRYSFRGFYQDQQRDYSRDAFRDVSSWIPFLSFFLLGFLTEFSSQIPSFFFFENPPRITPQIPIVVQLRILQGLLPGFLNEVLLEFLQKLSQSPSRISSDIPPGMLLF